MSTQFAIAEARRNPQAYFCLGVVILSGFIGVFTAFFAIDLFLRTAVPVICVIVFLAGIVGHRRFKKLEASHELHPNRRLRLAIGAGFMISAALALAFSVWMLSESRWLSAVLPVFYAAAVVPFARAILKDDDNLA